MKKIMFLFALTIANISAWAQAQVTTTGNNVINTGSPYSADIVIGSDLGTRHDASMMWWSNASASRISNTADVFYLSVWSTTTPNIALAAGVGGTSYFLGNVGIGTPSPGQKLDVNGNIRLTQANTLYFDSSNGSSIRQNGTGAFDINASTAVGNGNITINPAAAGGALYLNYASGNGIFLGNGASAVTGVINNNGSVGINTTYIPMGYQLAVNGSAIATSMTVQLRSAWPDFVFKPTYSLPSLSFVKTYIDQNHHLPEIPSAADVEKDGLNLGEMNKLLLKKVEELTLYLIEKDKEDKVKQEEIDQLKQQVAQLSKAPVKN